MHRGEREREAGEVPHRLAEAGAAYAGVGDAKARARRRDDRAAEESSGDEGAGEGETSGGERDEEGGAD